MKDKSPLSDSAEGRRVSNRSCDRREFHLPFKGYWLSPKKKKKKKKNNLPETHLTFTKTTRDVDCDTFVCRPSRHRSSFSPRCLWANICPVNSGNFNYLWITQLSTVQSLQECLPVLFLQTSSIKTRSRPLRPQVIDGSVKFINRVSWYLAGCGLRAKKYISFHSSLTSRWLVLRALPRRESGLCLAWWVNFPGLLGR